MRFVHSLTMSVFIKPEEDAQAIERAIISLAPIDFSVEKVKIEKSTAQGFEGRSIKIITIRLTKHRTIQAVLNLLNKQLSEKDKNALRTQENRVDNEQNFFLRLDKQSLLKNKHSLTDGGECIHVKLALAAYPKTRESALAVVPKIFPQSI